MTKVRTHSNSPFSTRMNHSATPLPIGALMKLGLDSMTRK